MVYFASRWLGWGYDDANNAPASETMKYYQCWFKELDTFLSSFGKSSKKVPGLVDPGLYIPGEWKR